MSDKRTLSTVDVDGKKLQLSNLSKVLYPKTGFTKADVIHYYSTVASTLLPHIANRPLTLKRYPNGVGGEFFYEKHCPSHRPSWVDTASVSRSSDSDEKIHYCLATDKPTLVWVANLASIELHVLLSTKADVQRPTHMAFDLDPGPGMTLIDCAKAAVRLRELLKKLNLQSFPKTSGKKGLHVYVPLNTAVTFDQTKPFAHAIALAMEHAYPDDIVSNMRKDLRKNKVFVDWSQNDDHKTTVAAYSLRAWDRPTVSTPVTWEEIESVLKKKNPSQLIFEADDTLKRIKKLGDLFAPVLRLKQTLPELHDGRLSPAKQSHSNLLATYKKKRDFSVTPEPSGPEPAEKKRKPTSHEKSFVIQKHDATSLHYDFRLEEDGVLKSWAVPKGPSTDPGEKRLAMMTEDHPLDYGGFEGVIPEGEYGGGPVMVWDRGSYVNLTTDKKNKEKMISLSQGIRNGHIDFWLKGEKLNGAWALIRTSNDPRRWLMIKKKDGGALKPRDPVNKLQKSVLTGRTIHQILSDRRSNVWHSNR